MSTNVYSTCETLPVATLNKLRLLENDMTAYGRVLIAFSGGVDSSLLLKLACDCLGPDNVLAVTSCSPLIPDEEISSARAIAMLIKVPHMLADGGELAAEDIIANSPDRCYYCKAHKLERLCKMAAEQGYRYVLEGSNQSDTGDYRPGLRALQENPAVISPFLRWEISKDEIRAIAQCKGLPNWDQPSQACLASRIPYGTRIEPDILNRIARAEAGLRRLGLTETRLRYHGDIARIETDPAQIGLIADPGLRASIVSLVKDCGFGYVTLDLQGYRTGSLNEGLTTSRD